MRHIKEFNEHNESIVTTLAAVGLGTVASRYIYNILNSKRQHHMVKNILKKIESNDYEFSSEFSKDKNEFKLYIDKYILNFTKTNLEVYKSGNMLTVDKFTIPMTTEIYDRLMRTIEMNNNIKKYNI